MVKTFDDSFLMEKHESLPLTEYSIAMCIAAHVLPRPNCSHRLLRRSCAALIEDALVALAPLLAPSGLPSIPTTLVLTPHAALESISSRLCTITATRTCLALQHALRGYVA